MNHVVGVLLLALSLGCGPTAAGRPATLTFSTTGDPDLTSRGAAAVRLRVQDGRTSLLRSGVIIDPRGYVLTSFSAIGVGEARASAPRPGTLHDGGEVQIEVFEGPFGPTPVSYDGRVVRGDLRLNLALVHIESGPDGPIDPSFRFPAVDTTPSDAEYGWGAMGWAIGAGQGVPTLVAHHASLVAGIFNSEGAVAGYLVSMELPTLDGAGYYDAAGAFLGTYSRGFVRPASRIPSTWRDELAAGDVTDRRIDGITTLVPGDWSEVTLIGDAHYDPPAGTGTDTEATEEFLFTLPAAQAGTITVVPPVTVVAYQRGHALQSGTGEIFIPAEPDVYIAVRMPRSDDPRGLRLRVRFQPSS